MTNNVSRRSFFKMTGATAAVGAVAAVAPVAVAQAVTPTLRDKNGVGVYNEWDQMESVLVGHPDRFLMPEVDWPLENYQGLDEEIKVEMRERAGNYLEDLQPETHKQTQKEMNALAELFEKHGVEVIRPEQPSDELCRGERMGQCAMYERDNTLVIEDEIIDTYCRIQCRRKSHELMYRDITKHAEENGQYHLAMPRPSIHVDQSDETIPYLEGGDVFILDKDILVGHAGIGSSYAGIEWLRNRLEPKGYRVHTIELSRKFIHLDCVFMTPRPGLAACNLDGVKGGKAAFPAFMQDWTWIDVTEKECKAMGANSVNLAPNKPIIGAEHTRLIAELEKHGVECITLPYATTSMFGGGPRCSTHPLKRKA
ncbi:twin-arginine translocation signal domain-containing protein [Vibrio mediterranei]|uniref:dimethylarginine dimethylaminohydrolase family protein n=1 Tax=Vibrio mediterranei TaxID=689 RepID=UPI00182E2465|nr:arginine deiminase family protein [Vibrio mediterranei]NUW71730.1 twin-arginine translocation signal domain-containing protein [Vibrio mediterranei]